MTRLNLAQTSLSKLSDHDWHVLQSQYFRGIDWYVRKVGGRWAPSEAFGNFPLSRTKREAGERVEFLMRWEARNRAALRYEAEGRMDEAHAMALAASIMLGERAA